jgi:hypothetical protein
MVEIGDLVAYQPDRESMKAQGVGLVVAREDKETYDGLESIEAFIVEWIVVPFGFSDTNICSATYLVKLND